MLTELVRKSLGRVISDRFSDSNGRINLLSLDPRLEEEIREKLEKTDGEVRLNLPPSRLRQIAAGVSEQIRKAFGGGWEAVIVADSQIRPYFRRIVTGVSSDIPVIAWDEISDDVEAKNVGVIAPLEEESAYAAEPDHFRKTRSNSPAPPLNPLPDGGEIPSPAGTGIG